MFSFISPTVASIYLCTSLFNYCSLEKLKRWCWIVTLDAYLKKCPHQNETSPLSFLLEGFPGLGQSDEVTDLI